MNTQNVLYSFLEDVPELKTAFEEQCEENMIIDNDGAYVVWGMGLWPLIETLFVEFNSNTAILKKIFSFFEKMACSDDEEIHELLMYSILENLGDDKIIYEQARSMMGETTLAYSKRVEGFLGR